MKNYLFLTKDGFTFDPNRSRIENMQVLGTGVGNDVVEAFNSFKYHQSYLKQYAFQNVMAVEYVGDFIMNLEL
jgi:hypothetical protein